MTLWATNYRDENGRLVEYREEDFFVWVPVDTKTGEVESFAVRASSDQLPSLIKGSEWRKFKLIPA